MRQPLRISLRTRQSNPAPPNLDAHKLLSDAAKAAPSANGAVKSSADGYLPSFNVADFQQRVDHLLPDAKLDADGGYKQADLAALMSRTDLKGEGAYVAATLYDMYKVEKGGSGATAGSSGGGATSGGGSGLDAAPEIKPTQPPPPPIHSLLRSELTNMAPMKPGVKREERDFLSLSDASTFDKLDKDHNNRLSLSEVQSSPRYKQLLKDDPALKQAFADSKNGLDALEILNAGGHFTDSLDNTLDVAKHYASVRNTLAHASTRSLYGDATDSKNREAILSHIKIDDVHQGAIGDCYFEAALAAVVKGHPEIISKSIKDNKDGSYTVNFKGDPAHPITVAAPTDAELAVFARTNAHGVWPAVMEKAYAKYAVDVLKRPKGEGTNQDAIEGGWERGPLELMTGNHTQSLISPAVAMRDKDNKPLANPYTVEGQSKAIAGALAEKRAVTVDILGDDAGQTGLSTLHSYTLVRPIPAAQGGGFVLRDPRGVTPGHKTAEVTISADDIQKTPFLFTVETDKPLGK